MTRQLIMILILSIFTATASAHGSDENHDNLPASVAALVEKMNILQQKSVSENRAITSDEMDEIGSDLVQSVEQELESEVQEQQSKPLAARFGNLIKSKVLDKFNVKALGYGLWNLALSRGAYIAAAIGVSEVAEKAALVFSAMNPHWAFLMPIAGSEVTCIAATTIAMGVPEAKIKIELWRKNGGLIRGISGYYQKLLRQRRASSFDWNQIVQAREIRSKLNADTASFVVTNPGKLRSKLSRVLWLILDPGNLAVRDSNPNVSIPELEDLAKVSSIDTKWIKLTKSDPLLYSTLLLRQIDADVDASKTLQAMLETRGLVFGPRPEAPTTVDLNFLLRASPEELSSSGETPDSIASRVLWDLRRQQKESLEEILEEQKALNWEQGKIVRKLEKNLNSISGLRGIAETENSSPSFGDWINLSKSIAEVRALLGQLHEAETLRSCRAVFTSH